MVLVRCFFALAFAERTLRLILGLPVWKAMITQTNKVRGE